MLVSQVAAQNCRKRKIDQIKQLETEVGRRTVVLVAQHLVDLLFVAVDSMTMDQLTMNQQTMDPRMLDP